MKTIIFIGCNKSGSSREAIKAAERLGFFTVLFTDREYMFKKRTDFPDIHRMILTNLSNIDLLKENIKAIQDQGKDIAAILSFIDPYVHVAAQLSKEFNITAVPPEPLEKMEDKLSTRELLKDLSVSPYFARIHHEDEWTESIEKQAASFPLIVKTPVSTGSKDVLLVKNKKQLTRSIHNFFKKGSKEVLLEEYLDGPQYLVEICVYKGQVHIIAVIEQEITFSERFIVTGYSLLGNMDKPFYEELYKTVSMILDRFNLKNGSCHLEMRLVNNQWKLIEINPRISGGAMNRIIEIGTGINLVEETIKIFLGQEPNLERKYSKYVFAQYLISDATGELLKVTGRNRCSRVPGVEEVFIKPKKGKILHPPLSMGDRYGYVLAASENKEEARKIAKEAAKEIKFYIEPIE